MAAHDGPTPLRVKAGDRVKIDLPPRGRCRAISDWAQLTKTYDVVALPDSIVARSEALQMSGPRLLLLPVVLFAAAAFGQQETGSVPADLVYARPGQLVDAGGFRLNLYCMGSGSPTVVFDSGWGDWAPAWSKVQPEIAKWTRACSYDRAGTGFSDPGPMPRTSVRIAKELHNALHHAAIGGPYIRGRTAARPARGGLGAGAGMGAGESGAGAAG